MTIFPEIKDDARLHSYIFFDKRAKPDIVVSYKHYASKISIKCGHNPTMHMEYYNCFMKMLKQHNLSNSTLETFELYHFGRTSRISNNGSAYTREELIEKFGDRLESANLEINANRQLVEDVIHRGVIHGYNEGAEDIDYLYYGSTTKGYILNKDQIYTAILNDKKKEREALHFGGLIYQPGGRDEHRIDRYYSKLKWPILCVKFYVPGIF